MRVLLIKLSSMGDVIHTLPALSDAAAAIPGIKFTWLVEESFAEIPHWHPAVEQVIVTAVRKRNRSKILASIKQIRKNNFDLVIDAQGLIKSAVFARLARTRLRAGYGWRHSREAPASLLYNRRYKVDRGQHAIDRMRQLFAAALNYNLPSTAANYAIKPQVLQAIPQTRPYLVFLHGTTWETKHWPDDYWCALADLAAQHGLQVQVTWATPEQKQRAQKLVAHSPAVKMLPHLTLDQAATVLHNAQAVVAVDTGFAHLSAALEKPLVAIYGASDVRKAGAAGTNSVNLAAKLPCSPCNKRSCTFTQLSLVKPPCMQQITPQQVWDNLVKLGCV